MSQDQHPAHALRAAPRRRVLSLPPPVYDLTQLLFFPINYAIGGLCYLQPQTGRRSAGEPSPSVETLKQAILSGADIAYAEQDLLRLYDTLEPVSAADDMIGHTWRGRILRTRSSVLDLAEWAIVRPLGKLGIHWGKRYRSADKGDPLLLNWRRRLYIPVPLWGNVGMTDIRFRGVPTATMNYDHQPWKDYFKWLENQAGQRVLLGVWTHKHIAGGWFTLTLDEQVPTPP